jgi:hypothetical protein
MSVNSLPEKICLTPAELFLLIQYDRGIWELCEEMEEALLKLQKLPAKKLVATFNTVKRLAFKSTRNEIIKEVINLGYKESYAEKLVDGVIRTFKELLGSRRDMPLHITAEPKPVKKGRFGNPYSRWEQDRGEPPKPGRPPLEYKIEEHPKVKLDERMEKLLGLVTLLSGSFIHYLKLSISSIKTIKIIISKLPEGAEERKMLSGLSEEIEKVDLEKLGELEKHIEDWYRRLMEPVWKDAARILGLELSIEEGTAGS